MSEEAPQSRSTRNIVVAVAIVVVAIAAAATWLTNSGGGGVSGAPIESIAVLPFENAGGDPDTAYLSDGLTDRLIDTLSQVQDLRVVPRSTMFTYKGRTSDPRQLGRDLGVQAVLSGQVTQRGDALVVKATLMDVSNGSNLWSDTVDRKIADLVPIEKDIVREVFRGLRVALSGDETKRLTTRSTTNSEALNLYYRGLYHRQKTTEAGLRESIHYFQQAVDLDPRFALANVGLSDLYGSLGYLQVEAPAEIWPRAKAAADAALGLDPDLAEALAARGHVLMRYDWNPQAAKAALERSIELNPRYAIARHWYSHYLVVYEPGPVPASESRKAVDLEPNDLMMNTHFIFVSRGPAQTEQLEWSMGNVRQVDPDFWALHVGLASGHVQKRNDGAALKELERAVELSGGLPLALQTIGLFHATRGQKPEAEGVIARLEQRPDPPPMHIASIYARLGNNDKAVEWLERAFKDRDSAMIDVLARGWADARKADPRIDAIAKRVGEAKR